MSFSRDTGSPKALHVLHLTTPLHLLERSQGVLVRTLGGPMVLLTDPALDHSLVCRLQFVQSALLL